MKTWLVGLIAFALIAGYKVFSYQHQLSESNAEKERLTSVLDRSRATETSELKVMKPATKLVAGSSLSDEQQRHVQSSDSIHNTTPATENVDGADSVSSESFYSETEGALVAFFSLPTHEERFVLSSIKCENRLCELVGEYNGSESELSLVMAALEQEPWWHFGAPEISTELVHRGLKLNVSFTAEYLPDNKGGYGNGMQADLNQKVASAG